MYATDFVYDGTSLSSFGCTICRFDGDAGLEEVQAGAPLSFSTVSRNNGNLFTVVDVNYESCLEATFDICKDPCEDSNLEMSDTLYLQLTRWLLRNEFLTTNFVNEDHSVTRYYNGAFNASKIFNEDKLIGLRLTFVTDRPYALGTKVTASHTFTANSTWNYTETSYITGTIVPDLKVTCSAAGTLTITNTLTGTVTTIKNCTSGEVITFDGQALLVSSSNSNHNIYNDFNFKFLKLGNSYSTKVNPIKSSLACTMQISYQPIIRDAP